MQRLWNPEKKHEPEPKHGQECNRNIIFQKPSFVNQFHIGLQEDEFSSNSY